MQNEVFLMKSEVFLQIEDKFQTTLVGAAPKL